MRFEGSISKQGRFWVVDIPALNAGTQGLTKREGYEMAIDLLETMADTPGFTASIHAKRGDSFEIGGNDAVVLVSLLLRRQRQKNGLTLDDAARRMGQSSPNAYSRYERREAVPSIAKLEELLEAVAPGQDFVWRVTK